MFLLNSLLACLILAIIMPYLGQRVLHRRVVFVDLALAQIAATGYALGLATDSSGMLWAAMVTVIAIFLFAAIPHASRLPKEAVMGAMYAVAAATGMVILSHLPHAEGHMSDLMFGSLLGAGTQDLLILLGGAVIAVVLFRFASDDNYTRRLLFYLGLAVAIVPAIHVVGIILVFGMLLLPALSVWEDEDNGSLWQALLVGLIAAVTGIFSAEYFDLPPSSSVVVALFLCGLPVFLWKNCSKKNHH